MLVIKRRIGETVRVGPDVIISVLDVEGEKVKLGFDAPREITILRGELEDIARENEVATRSQVTSLMSRGKPPVAGEGTIADAIEDALEATRLDKEHD